MMRYLGFTLSALLLSVNLCFANTKVPAKDVTTTTSILPVADTDVQTTLEDLYQHKVGTEVDPVFSSWQSSYDHHANWDAAYSAIHNPVTLDTNAQTILSLSTQALGLQTQAANTVWAGRATAGTAVVPTFRSLVALDIPDLSATYLPLHSKADTSGNADTVTNGIYLNGSYTSGFMKWNGSSQPTQDTSTYLTSYAETDPVVKAIVGVVKSNGTTISACSNLADVTYLTAEADTLNSVLSRGNTSLLAITAGGIRSGSIGVTGQYSMYSHISAGVDWIVSLNPNSATSANADFYLPPAHPSSTYLLNMTSGGVVGYDTNTYLTSVGTGVANEITYWSGTNAIGALDTATYPSLTELSYVKGVTSGIQSQLNGKQASGTYLKGDGTVTGATSQAQTFTDGLITGLIYPSADSTAAFQINKHDGTTNVLNVDTTNGRVGIGTTSPSNKLEVNNTAATNAFDIKVGANDLVTTGLDGVHGYLAVHNISGVNNANYIYLLHDGVDGYIKTNAGGIVVAGANQTTGFRAYNPSSPYDWIVMWHDNSAGHFSTRNSTPLVFDQKVGIGTTGPSVPLEVNGVLQSDRSGSPTQYLQISGGDINGIYLTATPVTGSNGKAFLINNSGAGDNSATSMQFQIAGATKMAINNLGNVGIGTTAPGAPLQVNGKIKLSDGYPIQFFQGGGTVDDYTIRAGAYDMQVWVPNDAGSNRGFRIGINNSGTFSSNFRVNGYTGDISTNGVLTASGAGNSSFVGNVGIGTTSPTAVLHLKAGTATASTSPLKFTLSGAVLNTTAEAGAYEVDSSGNLYFTDSVPTRMEVHRGGHANVTLTAGTTTTVTEPTAKTTSTIILSPTSLAVIALSPYVSAKNAGSFVITTLSAVGNENLDYAIIN